MWYGSHMTKFEADYPAFCIRFRSKIRKTDGCWTYLGRKIGKPGYNYGACFYPKSKPRKNTTAHRIMWLMTHGEIAPGNFICHKCDNPECVNPDHLFEGSPRDNTKDCINKGRFSFNYKQGHLPGNHKLTVEQVKEIRNSYIPRKRSCAMLAREFNVSDGLIWLIISGK